MRRKVGSGQFGLIWVNCTQKTGRRSLVLFSVSGRSIRKVVGRWWREFSLVRIVVEMRFGVRLS